jgi:hypothetical protein
MVIYNKPSLVNFALPNAATPKNITSGFTSTGIRPFNKDIFIEEDYLLSEVTNRLLVDTDITTSENKYIKILSTESLEKIHEKS